MVSQNLTVRDRFMLFLLLLSTIGRYGADFLINNELVFENLRHREVLLYKRGGNKMKSG